MGLLRFVNYLPFLVFPLGVAVRIKLYDNVFVYPLDLSVIFVSLVFVSESVFLKRTIKSQPINALLLFLFWGAFSLLLNMFNFSPQEIVSSFMYWIRLCIYIIFFISITSLSGKVKKNITYFMLLTATSFTVIGLLQYNYYPNLGNLYYLGWDEHLYRVFSTLFDPNFAGVVYALFLPFLLSLIILRKNSKLFLVFLTLLLLTAVSALFLTYSRTGYVVGIVSVTSLLILLKKIKYLFLLLVVSILGIVLVPKDLRSEGVHLLRTASIYSRIDANIQGFQIFKSSPLYGVGFNTLRYVKVNKLDVKSSQYEDHSLSGVPNSYVFVLATTGIVGFVLFSFFIWSSLKYFYYKSLSTQNLGKLYTVVAFSTLSGITFGSFFENLFFYQFILFWLLVTLALGLGQDKVKDCK